MASAELGRQVAPEQKKDSIIARTITRGLTIGAAFTLMGCAIPQGKYDRPTSTPTNAAKLIEIEPTGLKPHCFDVPEEEKKILDWGKFPCDENGNPLYINNSLTTPTPIGAGGGIDANTGQTP